MAMACVAHDASLPEFGAYGTGGDATFCSARRLVACQLQLRALSRDGVIHPRIWLPRPVTH